MTLVHAGQCQRPGAGDDDVRQRGISETHGGDAGQPSRIEGDAGDGSAGNGTTDRQRMGIRADRSRQHSTGQWRRSHQGNHRSHEPRPASQAGRLGRAAGVGVGCFARARLSRNRQARRREARRHRRRLSLWKGRAGDDGVRSLALRSCWWAPPARAAPNRTGAILEKRSRISLAPASTTGWPATS